MDLDSLFEDAVKALRLSLHRDAVPRSKESQKVFLINLCIVALGIRAGFLIDTFSPAGGALALRSLLVHLQQVLPIFNGVKIVFAPRDEQYFFINAALCRKNINIDSARPTCVQVIDGGQILSIELPAIVVDAVSEVSAIDQLAIVLPVDLQPQYLVCFAGIILEYLTTYLPCPSRVLMGTQLHVYECFVEKRRSRSEKAPMVPHRMTLVKFSVPEAIMEAPSLSPRLMQDRLKQIFGPRTEKLAPLWELHITHEVVVQDKVVF